MFSQFGWLSTYAYSGSLAGCQPMHIQAVWLVVLTDCAQPVLVGCQPMHVDGLCSASSVGVNLPMLGCLIYIG